MKISIELKETTALIMKCVNEKTEMKNVTIKTMNLKQSILAYEKKKKPRDLWSEYVHYKALSRAIAAYAILTNILLIVLLILK